MSGPPPRAQSAPSPQARPQTRYPVPLATGQAVTRNGAGTNLSLALNKLVGPWTTGATWQLPKNEGDARGGPQANARTNYLSSCAAILGKPPVAAYFREFQDRRWAMLKSHAPPHWHTAEASAALEWRFVSGLGVANPLETNLVLHRIGGFPYIPGSGIKGATLAYVRDVLGEAEDVWGPVFGLPGREDGGPTAAGAAGPGGESGAEGNRGGVVFFDAVSEEMPKLELDVMTPHYGDYYQGTSPPADYLSPNPIVFLAVAPGTRFHFAVAARKVGLAERAIRWVQEAAVEQGFGAKTAAGYGFFTEEG